MTRALDDESFLKEDEVIDIITVIMASSSSSSP
jgi:hypothetical protein